MRKYRKPTGATRSAQERSVSLYVASWATSSKDMPYMKLTKQDLTKKTDKENRQRKICLKTDKEEDTWQD